MSDIVIIGAGLSGLATALLLQEAGKSVSILEARSRPGGRIHSLYDGSTGSYLADLGPTWVWPDYQPVVRQWLDKLNIVKVAQFESGNAILDYGPDTAPERRYLPGQAGIARLNGGPQALIDTIVSRLPESTIHFDHPVASLRALPGKLELKFSDASHKTVVCETVVVATPPRIALESIHFDPPLPTQLQEALSTQPTWMAPHAKAVIQYETAFWRDRGLSGRIASRHGPLVEAHDHSGPDGTPAALFGFIGWPYETRTEFGNQLQSHIFTQLKRCFGEDSSTPLSIHVEDWARDPFTATPTDLQGAVTHPEIGAEILRQPHYDGNLLFASAETARQSPGLIEGALVAAEQAADKILKQG
ncbi:MAG: FAD-dependent oxidoreductase [Proteobacteria bacterium]|nr:FAD-dependent oxidoreductase [Pseudomonadota bacterium]